MKTQCINLLKVIAVGIALSFAGVAHGLTPDGETPSTESVCDGLTKKEGWGLCNAYCEAMACHLANDGDDTTAPKASAAACQKVYDNFLQKTGNVIACEDRDRDGVSNTVDNCPNVPNPDQLDYDKDGVGNVCDNCPKTASATQIDSDGDGLGDVCDNCPKKVNSEQLDGDADGFGDVCDNCPLVANKYQKDINTNGIGDACDCGDGVLNSTEACDPPGSTLIDGTTVTVCGPDCQYDKPIVCLTGDTCPCGAIDIDSLTAKATQLAGYAGITVPKFLGCAPSGVNAIIWGDSTATTQDPQIAFGTNLIKEYENTCGWGLVNVKITDTDLALFSEANDLTCAVVYDGKATYCYKYILPKDASSCTLCEGPICGNKIIESGEECDDGNTVSGDGCSADCKKELVFTVCGNGIKESGEECDDGNIDSGDGCSAKCTKELVFPVCGNKIIESGEECDDGNIVSGDGCSAKCTKEQLQPVCACVDPLKVQAAADACFGDDTYTLSIPNNVCDENLLVVDYTASDVDTGIRFSAQIFGNTCTVGKKGSYPCEADIFPTGDFELTNDEVDACQGFFQAICPAPASCGNGVLDSGEECDDGNTVSRDGCTFDCKDETRF